MANKPRKKVISFTLTEDAEHILNDMLSKHYGGKSRSIIVELAILFLWAEIQKQKKSRKAVR
jgi:hypothetical protein